MDPERFLLAAQMNQSLADYLDDIESENDPIQTMNPTLGVGLFFVVAAYASYHWVKNYLDHQQGLNEAELRKIMAQEVDALVVTGVPRDQALAAILAISKSVASRPPDGAILKAFLALFTKGS